MRRLYLCTISSQAAASPATQRRTSIPTTWASSNRHSPEPLVFQPGRTLPDTLRTWCKHHNLDTFLWSQKFATFVKQRIVPVRGSSSEDRAKPHRLDWQRETLTLSKAPSMRGGCPGEKVRA